MFLGDETFLVLRLPDALETTCHSDSRLAMALLANLTRLIDCLTARYRWSENKRCDNTPCAVTSLILVWCMILCCFQLSIVVDIYAALRARAL
jgi:hypothetical protein